MSVCVLDVLSVTKALRAMTGKCQTSPPGCTKRTQGISSTVLGLLLQQQLQAGADMWRCPAPALLPPTRTPLVTLMLHGAAAMAGGA